MPAVAAAVLLQGNQPASVRTQPRLERVRQVSADYTLLLRAQGDGRASFVASHAGTAALLLLGLKHGGEVAVAVNGVRATGVELLCRGGVDLGRADSALVNASLVLGRNQVEVTESDGTQVVRVVGTNRWFGASTYTDGGPLFSVDLDHMPRLGMEYPVQVNYGPRREGLLWFSAKWDRYYGEVYAKTVSRVRGSSGAESATLSYVLEYPPRHLVMPTRLVLTPDRATGAFTIRVHQAVRAVDTAVLSDGTEFLHVKLSQDGAWDWQDGTVDYAWYRSQTADCDDAPPGGRTGMVRVDDNTGRVYAFRSSTSDRRKVSMSSDHHTGAAVPLGAANTIGGYFSKSGVGSCGWVFHQYRASFRDDLTPVFGHCGDGADTHLFTSFADLYGPLAMRSGDVLETEYSLTMLASEVTREEIEDLNEADMYFFGTAKEQAAEIDRWIGSRSALGLVRSDGSAILLGLGREPARVPVPASTASRAREAYRLFCPGELVYERLDVHGGTVEVRPGWITIVDCGAALWEPVLVPGAGAGGGGERPSVPAAGDQVGAQASPWSQAPFGGAPACTLRRK